MGDGAFAGMSISDRLDLAFNLPDWIITVLDFFTGNGDFEGMTISDRVDLAFDLPDWILTILDLFTGEGAFVGMSIGDRIDLALGDLPQPLKWIKDLFGGLFDISIGDYIDFSLGALGDTWDFLMGFIDDPVGTFSAVGNAIWETLGGLGDTIWNVMKIPLNFVLDAIRTLLNSINFEMEIWNPLGDNWTTGIDLSSWAANIPHLAKGGIVTGPTLAMIGEAGPEAVVPLDKGNSGIGGTFNITVNAGGITDRSDKREMARDIGNMIQQELARTMGTSTTRGRFA